MATANEYLYSQQRCKAQAERSSSDAVRQAWLNLAESYAVLLMLEKIEPCGPLISDRRME